MVLRFTKLCNWRAIKAVCCTYVTVVAIASILFMLAVGQVVIVTGSGEPVLAMKLNDTQLQQESQQHQLH